jgi:protein-S-isoprenylcysteine O-methyltransferase Ste14
MARSLYKWCRHPLMLGFLIAFWATPDMNYSHLLFSIVVSAYIFIGIAIEERDLKNILGEDYRAYRERTSMIVPLPPRKK